MAISDKFFFIPSSIMTVEIASHYPLLIWKLKSLLSTHSPLNMKMKSLFSSARKNKCKFCEQGNSVKKGSIKHKVASKSKQVIMSQIFANTEKLY